MLSTKLEPKIVTEAKEHMRHIIASTLSPSITGYFQVILLGVRCTRDKTLFSEIGLRLVDRIGNPYNVLFAFGSEVIKTEKTISLDGLKSTIHPTPGLPGLKKTITGYFQVIQLGARVDRYGGMYAELELRIAEQPKDGAQVLYRQKSQALEAGQALSFVGFESRINFLPENFKHV